MKLEAGKSYYRRDGGVESIVETDEVNAWNTNGHVWYISGKKLLQTDNDSDLISEVPSADQSFTQTAEAGLSVVRKKEKRPTPQTDGQLASIAHEPRDVAVRKLAAALRGMERQLTEAREQRDRLVEALEAIWIFIEEDDGDACTAFPYQLAINAVKNALKGASHEQHP